MNQIRRIASGRARWFGFTQASRHSYSAEDIIQDVLLRMHRSRTFRTLSAEDQSKFAFRVAHNCCLDVVRKWRGQQTELHEDCPGLACEDVQTIDIELFQRRLPTNLTRILEAIRHFDWNKAKAAEALGLSEKSIQNRWSEIVKRAEIISCSRHDADSIGLCEEKTITRPKGFRS